MLKKILWTVWSVAMIVQMPQAAQAEERSFLGGGYLMVNDTFGDGKDRWRTGSAVASFAWGPEWDGAAPSEFGALLELRAGGEIMSPSSLTRQRSWDRRYASSVFLGLHTHMEHDGIETSLGAAVVAIGPMTNLDEIQSAIHRNADVPIPSAEVLSNQIQDTWRLRGVAEVGKTLSLGSSLSLRPFAELRMGDEGLARVGFDATLGSFGDGRLLARDSVTGHRYAVAGAQQPGWSMVVGADVAHVVSSVYLPEENGLVREDARLRARAGLHWNGKRSALFYGITWLGEEFEAQPESQLVGAINFTFWF